MLSIPIALGADLFFGVFGEGRNVSVDTLARPYPLMRLRKSHGNGNARDPCVVRRHAVASIGLEMQPMYESEN